MAGHPATRDRVQRWIRDGIVSHRDGWAATSLARGARTYLNLVNNHDDRIATNGEARVIEHLAACAPAVVFDIGANAGNWSDRVHRASPTTHIHAFEPVPESVAALRAWADAESLTVNEFGLGREDRTVDFQIPIGGASVLATSVEGGFYAESFGAVETRPLRIRRADEYCREAGLTTVDFAKIDVEGLEFDVLQGFGDLITSGSVRAIQFEYTWLTMTRRHLLGDFYDLLEPAGYEVGKIFPDRVEFSRWSPQVEQDAGPNHVAVHRDWPELRAALG